MWNDLLDAMQSLGPLYVKPCSPPSCKGVPRAGCSYLSACGSVCSKCGSVHSTLAAPWNIATTKATSTFDDALMRAESALDSLSGVEQRALVDRLAALVPAPKPAPVADAW